MTEPIPGQRALPILGNTLDMMHEEAPIRALEHLAEVYGPIYRIFRKGQSVIFVGSVELLDELCDDDRFERLDVK